VNRVSDGVFAPRLSAFGGLRFRALQARRPGSEKWLERSFADLGRDRRSPTTGLKILLVGIDGASWDVSILCSLAASSPTSNA